MPTAITACIDALPSLLMGSVSTVGMLLLALALGFVFGVPLAVAQVYGPRPVRWLAGSYVWFFRGVPILVQLYLFYYGLFALIGLNLNEFVSAAAVLGLTSSAYQSQIFRGSIQGLHAGQLKAARALGMSDRQAVTSIILPQALRLSIPAWSNEYSILLKDTAVAFVIGVTDIMARTRFAASRTYEHFALYILAGVLYFILTAVGVRLLRRLEKRVRIPGYAQQGQIQ